ncbi:MAG TPA: hypothetical protein ENL38_02880, partial [Candidatus Aminicenantes bacterium]|nr:hypothetical protein [Candidatus Aminicenantes bacterium]
MNLFSQKKMVPQLSPSALVVLKKRYLKKNSQGKVIETPPQLFWRVAKNIAQADLNYPQQKKQVKKTQKQFYQLLSSLDFLP